MKNFLLLFTLLLVIAGSAFGQAIAKGSGIVYTNGAPTHAVAINTDAEIAIDTVAGLFYSYNRDSTAWRKSGFFIERALISIAPTWTPTDKESEIVVNLVDSLYQWRSGAWHHLNAGGSGSQTLAATSDATSHTETLSGGGGSFQVVEGAGIELATTGTSLDGILTVTATDPSISNELQTYGHAGTTTYTNTLSDGGGTWSITGAGISVISQTAGAITVTSTEVDGSITNELQTIANTSDATSHTSTLSNSGGSIQLVEGANITLTTTGTGLDGIVTIAATSGSGTDLTFSGASSPVTLNSSTGTDVTFTEGGIVSITATSGNITITATEVDGSISNELQTYGHAGTTTYTNTLSDGGGTWSITGAGISVISQTAGAITVTSTEVDGSITNELQTIANTSDATSHTATLSNSGGSLQLVEGANITLTTSGTGLDGIVTIAATSGSGTDLTFSGASSPVTLNSSSGTDVTFTEGGIVTLTATSGNITITATEVDGSITNELQTIANTSNATSHTATLSNSGGSIQLVEGANITLTTSGTGLDGIVTIAATSGSGTDLTFSGASSPVTLNSSTGTDVTFTEGGIVSITATSGNITITATEVDGSITNELQTYGHAGTTTYTNTLSDGGGTWSITGAGISVISQTAGAITVTSTEVDGSITNELQTIANTSNATSHTATLSNSGGSLQLVEGANITLTTTGTGLDGILTIAAAAAAGTDLTFSGASSPVTLNSSTGTDVTFTEGGIVSITATSNNITITATEVDGSISNELQTYGHAGTTTYTNTLSDGGGTWSITGAGISVISQTAGAITVTSTEVDGSITNELQTIANSSDATSHTATLSNSGGSIQFVEGANITLTTSGTGPDGILTIAAAAAAGTNLTFSGASSPVTLNSSTGTDVTFTEGGIVSITATSGNITITATEVDGSITNELQTIANSSDATSHTVTLSNSGGSIQLVEGTNITLTTSGTGLDGIVTIDATGGGGTPAGANYQLQYYDTGAFGADAEMNFNPTTKRLVVGTTTPAAVLHARGQDDVADRVFLSENNSANDILAIYATGRVKLGDAESYPYFYQTQSAGGTGSYTAPGINFESGFNGSGDLISFHHTSESATTGDFNAVRQTGSFVPTTGTATYDGFVIDPTINVSGSASGLARGFVVSPTITSAAGGYQAFSTNLASGTDIWAFYGGGTAASRLGGTLGVGGDPVASFQLYSSGAVRMDGAGVIRGTGDSYTGDLATSHLRLWNTGGSADTWYLASMNNSDFKIASSNMGAAQLTIENTTGQVQTTNSLKIGTVTGTPTSIIGRDGTGQVGAITVSTGLDLTGGVLTATGGGGGGDILQDGNSFGANFVIGTNDNFSVSLEQNGTVAATIGTDKNLTLVSSVAATNTVTDRLIIQTNSTGTAAASFGSGILFQAENTTTNNQDQSEITSYWKNPLNGAEISAIDFKLRNSGGALATAFSMNRSGSATGMFEVGTTTPAQITNSHYYVNTNYEFGAAAFSAKLSSTTNEVGLYRSNTTATNTAVDFSVEARANGAGAAGYGTQLIFKGESSTTVARELGGIQNIWTTATDASRTSDMVFRTTNSATTAESFRLYGNKRAMVGGGTNEASAAFQVTSTSGGMLPPKMTNAQMLAIASPTEGLRVHNTTTKGGCTYDGTIWKRDNCSVTPSIAAGTGAGTGGSASIVGNDLGGVVSVTCGTSPATNSPVATITFATALEAAPKAVLINVANENSINVLYLSGATRSWLVPDTDYAAGSWIIRSGSAANNCVNGTTYKISYTVKE